MFKNRLFSSKFMLPREAGSVYTVEDYKAIPKEKRELNGWYLVPFGLQVNLGDFKKKESEWDKFYAFVRQEYFFQWFFRHWITSWDNPVYAFLKLWYMKYQDVKHTTKRFFKPYFPRWRKSCKRHEYKDICSLVVDSNFALILDFWYEEVVDGFVNWQSQPSHKQFYNEIKKNVKYIEEGRKKLEDKSDIELSKATNKSRKLSYQEKYGKYNKIEEQIKTLDTAVLVWLANNRNFFWT